MEVLKYGHQTLKEPSIEITQFDHPLEKLADEMYHTMTKEKGIGLAAPQVGVLKRLIIIDIEEGKGRINLVNPVISSHTGEIEGGEEGCLSVPEIFAEIDRFKGIHVEAQSLIGEKLSFNASDLLARVIQHEIDHLDGILFIDRLDKLDKMRLKGDLKKVKKKYRKVYA